MAPAACGIRTSSPSLQTLQKLANPRKARASAALAIPQSLHPPSNGRRAVGVACTGANEQQSSSAVAAQARPGADTLISVEFLTQDGCRLGIGRYPDFAYNARGGRGVGAGRGAESGEDVGAVLVDFDVATLYIPPMSGATTRFLGLPLPPFLKIDILPEALGGTINRTTGQVDLKFRSRFCFSVGSIYKAPPLFVDTTLTSEESRGAIRSGTGERMDGEGRCKLVGVAVVDPIDDLFMNTFLSLPTECIAYLNATISIAKPR
ncbi:hypothetical protein PR202_ga02271 [Eleusine coracana subsp. coracana]|uniref:Uncharacterized protein n=1 Tax=Eleusine coracana subsp. coracana TaxID=191504 RepID=A0AAV5BJ20_ELECO|nr:hypothetical protein QOZ80_2AG0140770 [Eleusine coracana subsp. coracana]GJM86416.1 hypothetical protein PR202_ga02271 [Eleusine coracana subsp. coracana]